MADDRPRILIVVHGHPDSSKGGAEIAAHHLFRHLSQRDDCQALFLARAEGGGHGTTPFSGGRSEDEVLFHTGMQDYFLFRSADPSVMWRYFRSLLQTFQPTVVHFHHFIHMGLEMLREVRNVLPRARIVLTLHEYLAICNNQGQMITTGTGALCYRSSPAACHGCFPDRSPGDFFMRERYIKSFLSLVDVFVSPSRFLIDRYVQWGIPEERMVMIENGQPAVATAAPRHLLPSDSRNRFAFFGQMTPFKGIDLLLEAVAVLPETVRRTLHVDIHGGGMEAQPAPFRERIEALHSEVRSAVSFHGAYQTIELPKLMAKTDWVVLPSVWWENSPVVIQEAFQHRRPVIGADIGGMAEKVRHGEDGLHFRCGNARDLADVLHRAMTEPGLWDDLAANIRPPLSVERCAEMHWGIYTAPRPASRP